MLDRLMVSVSLAFLAVIASTGVAYAASDREKVAIGTFFVAVGVIVVLSIAYALKRALGLEKPLPPEDVHLEEHTAHAAAPEPGFAVEHEHAGSGAAASSDADHQAHP